MKIITGKIFMEISCIISVFTQSKKKFTHKLCVCGGISSGEFSSKFKVCSPNPKKILPHEIVCVWGGISLGKFSSKF